MWISSWSVVLVVVPGHRGPPSFFFFFFFFFKSITAGLAGLNGGVEVVVVLVVFGGFMLGAVTWGAMSVCVIPESIHRLIHYNWDWCYLSEKKREKGGRKHTRTHTHTRTHARTHTESSFDVIISLDLSRAHDATALQAQEMSWKSIKRKRGEEIWKWKHAPIKKKTKTKQQQQKEDAVWPLKLNSNPAGAKWQ